MSSFLLSITHEKVRASVLVILMKIDVFLEQMHTYVVDQSLNRVSHLFCSGKGVYKTVIA